MYRAQAWVHRAAPCERFLTLGHQERSWWSSFNVVKGITMQGNILVFHPETNTGIISGHDGTRYSFSRADWTSPKVEPQEGLTIDFDTDGKKATQIIVLQTKPSGRKGEKTKTAAILWCLFFGWMGAHKFYLGQPGWGIMYLLFCWTAVPAIVSIIELIALIIIRESDFNRKYNY